MADDLEQLTTEPLEVDFTPVKPDRGIELFEPQPEPTITWLDYDESNYPVVIDDDEPYDDDVSDSYELATTEPETSTDIERHVNEYIATEDDMNTASDWLQRMFAEPQQQLSTNTHTQPQTLTQVLAKMFTGTTTKTKTKRRKRQPSASVDTYDYDGSYDSAPPYLALYERNPDESDKIHYLRLAFMAHGVTDGDQCVTEEDFWEWESSLSGDERATAIELGRMIDRGEFGQTMNSESRERWDTLGGTIRGIGERIFRLF